MKLARYISAVLFLVTLVASNSYASIMAAALAGNEPVGLRWRGRTIRIAISNSLIQPNSNIKADSDVLGALDRSIKAWQNAADIAIEIEMSDQQNVSPSGVSGDEVSLITIAQSQENVLLFSKNPFAESAKTRVFYNRKGFITEADVVLNPFQQFSTDGTFGTFDLESTLTHEIGHMLGLRHSSVLGAAMSESLSKNGTFGLVANGARSLADSDVAAIRELYGVNNENESCCAVINGKLALGPPRTTKNLRVWAEDIRTGRVAAEADASVDGSFKLGGLPAGNYLVLWQKRDDDAPAPIGEIGAIKVEKGEVRTVNEKISLGRYDTSLSYIGINNQLADSAVSLNSGKEYTLYLGGKNLDPRNVKIEFNSPFFKLVRSSVTEQDFGEGVSVISFVVVVDGDTPAGNYSIFATGEDGAMCSLVGALSVK